MKILCNHCGAFAHPAADLRTDRPICRECFSHDVVELASCDHCHASPAAQGTDYCAPCDVAITLEEAALEARQERIVADYNRRAAA